jgi:hypothetical protein
MELKHGPGPCFLIDNSFIDLGQLYHFHQVYM